MKEVFNFLKALSKNNNRDWMHANKPTYLKAKESVSEMVSEILKGIGQFDENLIGLQPKDCMFRINRDIRFSKNKDPYKTNFGAAMTEGGRKTEKPTYYIHLEPGKSILAGGMYMPGAENLKKIRQEIDYNSEELKKIVSKKSFRDIFGEMQGESLKTAPKGYPKDHPNIELLRFKSFLVVKNLPDEIFLEQNYVGDLVNV
jgi:uncharacterized protein (TIGR02453 family)